MRLNLVLWTCGLTLAACLVGMWNAGDRSRRSADDATRVADPEAAASPPRDSRSAEIRAGERRRAPRRPTEAPASKDYETVYAGARAQWDPPTARDVARMTLDAARLASTERRPETRCRSFEIVPKATDGPFAVASGLHENAVYTFGNLLGAFGNGRMTVYRDNDRGIVTGSVAVDRVELVGLLMHDDPCVYVMDEMATPAKARFARHRPLDEFEERGLYAVRGGAELVWTREASTRMFGALRAEERCLTCHPGAKQGELLGAFTYYLDRPIEQLEWESSFVHRKPAAATGALPRRP